MNALLTRVTTYMLGFGRALEGGTSKLEGTDWDWVTEIVNAIDTLLYPLLIVVGAAGMIYSVVLGVNMARADSTEKREEAKKRLINVVVGIVIVIALILFFKLFINTILPKFVDFDPNAQA